MGKFIIGLLILIFFQGSSYSQNNFRFDTDSSLNAALININIRIKSDSTSAFNYKIRAQLKNILINNEEALDDIKKAISLLGYDDPDYLKVEGNIYFDLNNYKNAIKCYRRVLDFDSLDWNTYIRLIEAYVKDKDYDGAMKVMTKELFPLYDQKPERWVEADAIYSIPFLVYDVYTNAFFDGIKNNEVMYGLGYTSIRINRIPDAIYYLNLYREMTPEDKINYEVENLLGLCYLKEGDTIQAKRNFEIAFQHGIEVPDSVKSVIIKEEISPKINEKRE